MSNKCFQKHFSFNLTWCNKITWSKIEFFSILLIIVKLEVCVWSMRLKYLYGFVFSFSLVMVIHKAILWTHDSYFNLKQRLNAGFVQVSLLQMITDGLEYCDVYIKLSFWRHPFTAEHPLLRHFSKPEEETHSSWSRMHRGWALLQHIFMFGWTLRCVCDCVDKHWSGLRENLCLSLLMLFSVSESICLTLSCSRFSVWEFNGGAVFRLKTLY